MRMRKSFEVEMDTAFKSTPRTTRLLFSFICILVMQCVSLLSQYWYVFTIDINRCLNCGRLIVTMGALLEQTIDEFERSLKSKDAPYNLRNPAANITEPNYMELSDEINEARFEDNITSFKIENHIHVYGGLWRASLCTDGSTYCVGVDTADPDVFAAVPPLVMIKDSVGAARLCLFLAITVGVFATVYAATDRTTSRSSLSIRSLLGAQCFAFLSFVGVVISCVPYSNMADISDVIAFHLPWSIIVTSLADNIFVAYVFILWRAKRTVHRTLRMIEGERSKVIQF